MPPRVALANLGPCPVLGAPPNTNAHTNVCTQVLPLTSVSYQRHDPLASAASGAVAAELSCRGGDQGLQGSRTTLRGPNALWLSPPQK